MESLFSFLIFAVLFYVMMRFGCGAHMVHGNQKSNEADQTRHIDPVCGKHLSSTEGYGKMESNRSYRFCSRLCMDAFEDDPHRYLSKDDGAAV